MRTLELDYTVEGHILAQHDSVLLNDGETLEEALARGVIFTISNEVDVTIGGVKMFLAAWLDPGHWESDWQDAGLTVSEVEELLSGAVGVPSWVKERE